MKTRRLLLMLSSIALLASCGGVNPAPAGSSLPEGSSNQSIDSTPEPSEEDHSASDSLPEESQDDSASSAAEGSSAEEESLSSGEQSLSSGEEDSSANDSEESGEGSSDESLDDSSGDSSEEILETGRVYIHDAKKLLTSLVMSYQDKEKDIIELAQDDEGATYWEAVVGSTLVAEFTPNETYEVSTATLNGDALAVEKGKVTFVVDLSEYDFLSLSVEYRAIGVVDEGDIALHAVDSDHLSVRFYRQDKVTEIASGFFNESIFIFIDGLSDRYSVRSLTATYYYGDLGSRDQKTLTVGEDGYCAYTVPYEGRGVTAAGVTFAVEELDAQEYADSGLVGTYAVINLGSPNYAFQFKQLQANPLTIDGAGHMLHGSCEAYISYLDEDNKELHTTAYSYMPYGEGFLLCNWGTQKLETPYLHSYDLLCFKMDKDELLEDYTVTGERTVIDGKDYVVASFYHQDKLKGSAYVAWSERTAYFNVDFAMNLGEKITDDEAFYDINKGGETIASMSYHGIGGVAARRFASSPCGVYHSGERTFVLPNTSKGVLDGVAYIADVLGNEVTLTSAERRIVISLDPETMAFVITSDEEIAASVPSFRGLTFKGKNRDCWGDEVETSIVFDNYEGDDAISGVLNADGTYSWSHPFGFTAAYDVGTNILTLTLTSEKYREGVVGHTIRALVAEGKMTLLDDANSIYTFKNVVLTCADFHL